MDPCHCGATDDVHLYPRGWRCPDHTPARLAGQPEPDTARYCAPNRCYCGACPSWTTRPVYVDDAQRLAVDAEAIRTGKRRSSPAAYRAARDQKTGRG